MQCHIRGLEIHFPQPFNAVLNRRVGVKEASQPASGAMRFTGIIGSGVGPVFVEGIDYIQVGGGIVGLGQGRRIVADFFQRAG